MVYRDDFTCWADVCRDYDCKEPEPDQVFCAWYSAEGYEGDSWVVYRNGSKFYEVEAGHCSCYGLEGFWEPEEYEPEIFLQALKLRTFGQYDSWKKEVVDQIISEISKLQSN